MLNGYTVINYHVSYISMIISYILVLLLPFLSEKHICILFLLKHLVLVECIDIKWYYMKQVYDYT